MSEVVDRFVDAEAERSKRIAAQMKQVEGTSEGLQPEFGTVGQAAYAAGLVTAPEVTILGTLGGELIKHAIKLVAPNYTGLQEIGEFAGNIVGGLLGDPAAREKLGGETIEKLAVVEKEFGTQAVQSTLQKGVIEARDRAFKIAQSTLKAGGIKETDAKLTAIEKAYKLTGNIYNAEVHGLLLNPRIPAQKLLTDTINLPVQAVFKGVGVASEHNLVAGTKTTLAALHGYRESYKDAWRLASMTFKSGEPEFLKALGIQGPESKAASYAMEAWDASPHATSLRYFKAIHDVYAAGSRLIMSSDQFAKALAYRGELRMNAFYDGLNKAEEAGLTGAAKMHYADLWAEKLVNDTPDWLHQKALEGTFKDTFTDQGKLVRAVENLRGQIPGARVAIPFFRTPANLIKQGIAMSPLAPLAAGKDMVSGGLDQKVAIAKWMIGNALYYEIAEQVAKGNITGDGPQGKGRELWPGYKHPRSVRIGGKWVSYAHLGPFAVMTSLAADSVEMYHASKNPESLGRLQDAVGGMLAEQVEHMPFIQEAYNMTHVVDSWKSGQSGKVTSEFLAKVGTSFIPSAVRLGAQVEDPGVKKAQGLKEMFMEDIPGWSKHVPLKRNEYGHAVYPAGAYDSNGSVSKLHYLANQMNPLPTYPDLKVDELDKEKYRLGYIPKTIPDHIWGEGNDTVPITEYQQDEWSRYTGHEFKIGGMDLHDRGMWLIKQPWYKKMPSDMQKKEMNAVHTGYFEAGKAYIMQKYQGLTQQVIQKQMGKVESLSSGMAAPSAGAIGTEP